MANHVPRAIPDPQSLDKSATAQAMADHAKTFWIGSLTCKALAGALGILSGIFAVLPVLGATATFAFAVLDEVLTWRSDVVKGDAEAFRRKVDAEDSLGWAISRMELSDLVTRYGGFVRKIDTQSKDSYFASRQAPGALRAVENVRESAWWSKHISGCAGLVCVFATATLLLPVVLTAVVVLPNTHEMATAVAVSRIASGIFLLLLTVGLARLSHSYYDFSQKAKEIEAQSSVLLDQSAITEAESVKLMTEYHLARATAPMLPTLIWKLKQDRLNQIWNIYVQKTS